MEGFIYATLMSIGATMLVLVVLIVVLGLLLDRDAYTKHSNWRKSVIKKTERR